jgi:HSP20 family protein
MAEKRNDLMSFPLRLSSEIERLLDDLIHRRWEFCREIRDWNPPVDLYENGNCFLLDVDLPGVKREDILVEIENGDLVLRGHRTLPQTGSAGRFRSMERLAGYFLRRLKLSDSVDASQIHVDFCNGVLRVTIPKIAQQTHD